MDSSALVLDLPTLQKHALRTILYYDIFRYPLTQQEVFQFLGCNTIQEKDVTKALTALKNEQIINEKDGYFFLGSDESLISRRLKGNEKAEKMLPLAFRISRFIGSFPFVKGVGLSGSLSKNYMDDESDIDFFIITDPERLWLTRTLLVLFKKVFLLNSRKYFCINYLITTDNLEIEDKNVFTATELVTMIPTYGSEAFQKFYSANNWVYDFLPNHPLRRLEQVRQSRSRGMKWTFESILKYKPGNWIDQKCMNLTTRVWQRKFNHMSRTEFEQALRSRENVSKHHPQNFQQKVLRKLKDKINGFENQTGLSMKEVRV